MSLCGMNWKHASWTMNPYHCSHYYQMLLLVHEYNVQ